MYYAHSANPAGAWHALADHLRAVAALARTFGTPLGLGDAAAWAGLLHDLGKYDPDFQQRLHDPSVHAPHAIYGGCVAAAAGAHDVALAVAAHHAGLADAAAVQRGRAERPPRHPEGPDYAARTLALLAAARQELPELAGTPPRTTGAATPAGREALELRTRLLLSCLVDADRLDTEAFFAPQQAALRVQPWPSLAELAARVDAYLAHLQAAAPPSVVNDARQSVLAACRTAASDPPGLATLTVPTGGGKTLASLAYALHHAARHGLRRVIIVVPFLAIIEQNAAVIRRALALGTRDERAATPLVLEHHSGVIAETLGHEPEDPQGGAAIWRRLATENWDAPVVITTAVQFLESLFTSRPSRARKLHRIAQAVVVFDEAQTVPPGLLAPILGMLRQLQASYGTSFLFCTATQPAFTERVGGPGRRWPAGAVREVMPDPATLFRLLHRVAVAWPAVDTRLGWPALAAELAAQPSALAIVNTKRQARALYAAVMATPALAAHPRPVLHLSARLCPLHRTVVLRRVRRALGTGGCLVVATQLVEAGVDLDFPTVYRALGPLDAIAQAAGRCNREGRLSDADGRPVHGRVVVFRPEEEALPRGVYRTATDVTQALLRRNGGTVDLDDPAVFGAFFDRLYGVAELDAPGIITRRRALAFREVDAAFQVIDDDTQGVLGPYGPGRSWIAALREGRLLLDRGLLRRLQVVTVNLYRREFETARRLGAVEEIVPRVFAVRSEQYDRVLGLVVTADPGDYVV